MEFRRRVAGNRSAVGESRSCMGFQIGGRYGLGEARIRPALKVAKIGIRPFMFGDPNR